MKKKLLMLVAVVAMGVNVLGLAGVVYAKDCTKNRQILGFKAWHYGLEKYMDENCGLTKVGGDSPSLETGQTNLSTVVWTVVFNILYDIFMAIGYLAIGFVIYGGYMYITSGGDMAKATKARKSIMSAVVGIILVLSANVIVDALVGMLNHGGSCEVGGIFNVLNGSQKVKLPNCQEKSAELVVANIWSNALSIAAIVTVGIMVSAGITYATSNGNPEKTSKALRTIIFAAIGLVIVLVAAGITNFVLSSMGGAIQ